MLRIPLARASVRQAHTLISIENSNTQFILMKRIYWNLTEVHLAGMKKEYTKVQDA